MAAKVFLAVDLGASSGRVVAGLLQDGRLQLDEVHRFQNGPVRAGNALYWDLLGLWNQVQAGLRKAAAKYGSQIRSVGIDTWGVDYGLLGRGDELLGNPIAYRDRRTAGMFEEAFARVSREEIFAETGLQFLEFNTLYQLLAAKLSGSPTLEAAESLLMIPDLLHWLLTGEKAIEQTNASTTQFYNPQSQSWSTKLLERLGLPASILGEIVLPGTTLGPLLPRVAAETNLTGIDVILPGTHDTASAVYAVPAGNSSGQPDEKGPNWCYVSSGTWSLMGVETKTPIINNEVARWNFTNEAGIDSTTRLLKNITGMWLVQECGRIWQRDGFKTDWSQLVSEAAAAEPLVSVIDPNDPRLVAPDNMPEAIGKLCRQSGQPVPETRGATVRCALESLALCYREVLKMIENLTGNTIETIHIVGGGCQNELLNQMAADACGRTVVAGPVEATAIGNLLVQVQAAKEVSGHAQARDVVRASFPVKTFEPQVALAKRWDEAADRFSRLSS